MLRTRQNGWLESSTTATALSLTKADISCESYKGVLLVQSGNQGAAVGTAFFNMIQSDYLCREVRLLTMGSFQQGITTRIRYALVMVVPIRLTIQGMDGMEICWMQVCAPNKTKLECMVYPGRPRCTGKHNKRSIAVSGTEVFESYFPPISEFWKGDKSYERLPIITMQWHMISCEECTFILHGRCERGNTWQCHLRTLQQRIRRSTNGLIPRSHAMQGTWDSEEILSLPTWDNCQCQQDSAREWNLLGKRIRHCDKWGARHDRFPKKSFDHTSRH